MAVLSPLKGPTLVGTEQVPTHNSLCLAIINIPVGVEASAGPLLLSECQHPLQLKSVAQSLPLRLPVPGSDAAAAGSFKITRNFDENDFHGAWVKGSVKTGGTNSLVLNYHSNVPKERLEG